MGDCIHSFWRERRTEYGIERFCRRCERWILEAFTTPIFDRFGQCIHPILANVISAPGGPMGVCKVCGVTDIPTNRAKRGGR